MAQVERDFKDDLVPTHPAVGRTNNVISNWVKSKQATAFLIQDYIGN